MKTFPTNFTTEKNKKTGASPVWILKCPFATGTIYLSDRAFTVASWNGGITTKSWIKSWSAIDENVSGQIATPQVADFTITVINDPDDASNVGALLWNATNKPETTDCELYLWFSDLNPATDPPQKIFVGNIIDFEQEDELVYRLTLVDQSVRYDKYVGIAIDTTTYPNADPDDIGKIGNIVYGTVKEVPARAVVAGALNYLANSMTASQTTMNLTDASRFPTSGTVVVDAEKITYTGKSNNQLTGLTRGANGTTATTHSSGVPVLEVRTSFTYEAVSHPVKALDNVYAVGNNTKVKITSICTLYLGNTGSQHPTWTNKGMVVIPTNITITQAIAILTGDGVSTVDATTIANNIAVNNVVAVNDLLTAADNIAVDQGSHYHSAASTTSTSVPTASQYTESDLLGNINTVGNTSSVRDGNSTTAFEIHASPYFYNTDWAKVTATITYNGPPPTSVFVCVTHKSALQSGGGNFTLAGNALIADNTIRTEKFNVGTSVPATFEFKFTATQSYTGTMDCYIYEMWLEIVTNQTTNAPATGVVKYGSAHTVSVAGNSAANTVIAGQIIIDAQGYQDDASGTITGTANALIEYPSHVIKHLLYTYSAWPLANFYTDAHTNFVNKPYKFAGVINEKKKLKEWLSALAFQCRCYFRFSNGLTQLLWRPDTLSSQKTITANMIRMQDDAKTTRTLSRSPLDEVINKIEVHYDRDWTQSGDDAYKGLSKTSDATSITAYGEKEKPEIFYFGFVTTQSMADDVRNFYIARYKNRKKLVEMELFLDNAEVEFGDDVTITPQSNLLGEVQKVNIYPGSAMEMRNDKLTVVVKEY